MPRGVICPYCHERIDVRIERHVAAYHPEFANRTRYEHVGAAMAVWLARRWEVTFAFGWTCLACGMTEAEARAAGRGGITIDHVVPRRRGGADNITNWQPLCWEDNHVKDDMTVDYRPMASVARIVAAYEAGLWPPPCEVIIIGRMHWCSVHEQPAGHKEREARSA